MRGKVISHYKIIEKIGAGGMGEVYLAEDTELHRKVAIKFLPEHLTHDEDLIKRFRREAQAAASLNHHNIVTIHDIIKQDDQICIVMEYIDGKSLRDVINEEKSLPQEGVIDVISQISTGLSKAHQAGIVHRDIKPENILIDTDGTVKILDFGLAKLKGVSKLTKDTTTLGTIQYMSPEQIRGKDVDHRSDIWSIGVVLYELLSGKIPFRGEYAEAIHYAILNEEPEALSTNVIETLRNVVNKCLAKSLDDRYDNIEDLVNDLQESSDKTSHAGLSMLSSKKRMVSITTLVSISVIIVLVYLFIPFDDVDRSKIGKSEWENSIAVLPFEDMSPDKDQEWFCDGMTEQVISNLGRLKNLKITGRQSVMKYKNSKKTIPEIGKELNVANILGGSVLKSGNRIRVTAQLIETDDGFHVWSQDFHKTLDDIFDIQDDISEKIAYALLTNLSPQAKKNIKTKRPNNVEAYEYYMWGEHFHRIFWSSRHQKDFLSAEKMLKAAIKHDPTFSDSYASLADLYNTHYYDFPDSSSEQQKYMYLQEAYIDSAYQLDPNSAEVNGVKGAIYMTKNKHKEAFYSLKKAITISPNNYQYYKVMGIFLNERGCLKLTMRCYDRAIEINPLDPFPYRANGIFHMILGDLPEAERYINKAFEIDSSLWLKQAYISLLISKGEYETVVKYFDKLKTEYQDVNFDYKEAVIYAINGQSRKSLDKIESFSKMQKMYLFSLLDMKDAAINEIQQMSEYHQKQERSRYLVLLNDPWLENMRSHPRFNEILVAHKEMYEENLAKYGDIDI